jgi:hypothetical protein
MDKELYDLRFASFPLVVAGSFEKWLEESDKVWPHGPVPEGS